MARPICFRLLVHWDRRAASRAAWTAGNRRAIKTAMMAMTTSSSMSVNAGRGPFELDCDVMVIILTKKAATMVTPRLPAVGPVGTTVNRGGSNGNDSGAINLERRHR